MKQYENSLLWDAFASMQYTLLTINMVFLQRTLSLRQKKKEVLSAQMTDDSKQ